MGTILILTTCIVNFAFTSTQTVNQMKNEDFTSKINDESRTRENFQNLFGSIMKDNTRKSEIYHEVLKEEVARERQVFDTMKEELRIAQNRNARRKINSYKNNNFDKSVAIKRETNTENDDTGLSSTSKKEDSESSHNHATQTLEDAALMCQGLRSLDIESFMKDVTNSFQYTCARLYDADEKSYQQLFNIVLTIAGHAITFVSENGTNLSMKTDRTIFMMEFKVNSTGEKALKQIEKYRQTFSDDDELHRDVLCLGINYDYLSPAEPSGKARLICHWVANLYFTNGTVKQKYTPHKITLTCA